MWQSHAPLCNSTVKVYRWSWGSEKLVRISEKEQGGCGGQTLRWGKVGARPLFADTSSGSDLTLG